ncbi:MAG: alpha/beta hydrolase [Parvibaculum sp.]
MQVRSNGLHLEVERFGPETGEPILLVMGLGGQLTLWPIELVEELVSRGYHVVRFDNRDVGLSAKFDHMGTPSIIRLMIADALRIRPRAPYLLDDMAKDAVGVLDALGIKKAHIVGVSMGGMISQLIAAHHGERVLSFTSIMSTTGHRTLPGPSKAARKALLAPPPKDPSDMAAIRQRMMDTVSVIGSPAYPMDETERQDLVNSQLDRDYHPTGLVRQIAAIVASGDRREALKKVTAPTVVLHGEDDPLVPIEGGRDTALHIRGAELVTVPGMGHDMPRALVPLIADTIEKATVLGRAASAEAANRAAIQAAE